MDQRCVYHWIMPLCLILLSDLCMKPMTSALASSENGPVLLNGAESECCGGLLDCTGLVFDDMEEVAMHSTTSVPTSNVRTENRKHLGKCIDYVS